MNMSKLPLAAYDLYDQLIADGRPSRWFARAAGIVYDDIDYAFKAGLRSWDYEPSNRWTKAAYNAGLNTVHMTRNMLEGYDAHL